MIALNTDANVEYIGNDSASVFAITFPTFEDDNILAEVEDGSAVITALTLGVDFSLDDIGIPDTDGELTLIDAGQAWINGGNLATGYTLRIKFSTEASQPSKLRDLGRFAPEAIERVLDRLTMHLLAVKESTGASTTDIAQIEADIAQIEADILALQAASTALETQPQNANFTAAYGKVHLITGNVNVQLPAQVADRYFYLKFTGAYNITLLRVGGENIEGVAANNLLTSTKGSVKVITDGTDWFFI